MSSRGRIKKALSGFYYVGCEDGSTLTCRARGKFRKEGLTPLVGDWVEVRETEPGCGMVWEIEKRRNAFVRPAVANIDQMVIVASAAVPVTDPFLIDRVTAIAALKNCDVVICVNKCDLDPGDALAEIYRQAGYGTKVVPVTTAEYGLSKAARPFNSRLDKSKLKENGFEPLPVWQDALSRYLKEIKDEI